MASSNSKAFILELAGMETDELYKLYLKLKTDRDDEI
jgi:hypothetical protein